MDPKTARKIGDENEEISREDFFKFAVDTKLLEFGTAMGESLSMGSLFAKPKKLSSPSPTADRRKVSEIKSPPNKEAIGNKEKKVKEFLI